MVPFKLDIAQLRTFSSIALRFWTEVSHFGREAETLAIHAVQSSRYDLMAQDDLVDPVTNRLLDIGITLRQMTDQYKKLAASRANGNERLLAELLRPVSDSDPRDGEDNEGFHAGNS